MYLFFKMNIGKGNLTLYIGPMFSGKTSKLLHDLETYSSMNLKVLYINSIIDTRSENKYSTHKKIYINDSNIVFIKTDCLSSVNVKNFDIIGVDEAGFFDDLVENIIMWVEMFNKIVIVSGLDGDYKRNLFGHVLELIPYSDKVIKFTAFCTKCMRNNILTEAPFTSRKCLNDKTVLVGGADKYESLCRSHFLEATH